MDFTHHEETQNVTSYIPITPTQLTPALKNQTDCITVQNGSVRLPKSARSYKPKPESDIGPGASETLEALFTGASPNYTGSALTPLEPFQGPLKLLQAPLELLQASGCCQAREPFSASWEKLVSMLFAREVLAACSVVGL